ncbi:MAG: class I SAM-dependent methyltransferase, partial [Ktedonobacterales bacterium]
VHTYPKLVLNQAQATCTDTIHRVKLRKGTPGHVVAAAFLNSLTFAFSEVMGRSYGGGVLELEPNEAERLPLPLRGADTLDLTTLDHMLRKGPVSSVLDVTDEVLLRRGLGMSTDDILTLRGVWEKLRDRRINRKPERSRSTTVRVPA